MYDKLEALESAIYAIEDAIDAIKELGKDYGADVDCLKDIKRLYREEHEEIEGQIAARDAADRADLEREYYKGVL